MEPTHATTKQKRREANYRKLDACRVALAAAQNDTRKYWQLAGENGNALATEQSAHRTSRRVMYLGWLWCALAGFGVALLTFGRL